MVDDEQLWLDALADRNNAAHAYNRVIAEDIVENAKEKYVAMFQKLKSCMEENWMNP